MKAAWPSICAGRGPSSTLKTLLATWAIVWGLALPVLSYAAELGAATATPAIRTVSAVLEEGRHLEEAERWGEVLSLYDRAAKEFPSDAELSQRRTLAQIHCDLDRRLQDHSYTRLVTTSSQRQAMDLYNELMVKVRSHYYETPDWQRVTWRGTASLDIAITKGEFQRVFLPQATDQQIAAFRQHLRNDLNRRPVRSQEEALQLVVSTAQQAQQYLNIAPAVTISEYCCGAISSLDPYSAYLTASELDEVYSQIEGNFVGLGIELKSDEQGLLIVKVIPQGPAHRAGIMNGERILAVNGTDTASVPRDDAADLLKGEENTAVRLALISPEGVKREVRVVRERVEVPSVEDIKIVDSEGTAYFRLSSFQKTTSRDVDSALWQLHRQGMQSLIIDLRGNPGGLLTAAVEVADKFLPQGVIVSTRGRSPREDFDYRAHQAGTWRVPLVVLIDHDTASASEILAGAIRDHGRGIIVGERSYGKGSVQGIFPLSAAQAGVRLTTARFYSPSGLAISDHGVQPHREVHVTAYRGTDSDQDAFGEANDDPMMVAAREAAREIVLEARARN